jgi:hypothetical protein
MPLYNKENEVERSLASVFRQTLLDFELIIVNDGSTDRGREVIKAHSDPRIRLIDQANAGVSAARNRGIEEARSEMVAFLDADDEWHPEFLATIMRLRREFPDCGLFATGYFICNDGNTRSAIIRRLTKDFSEGILREYFAVAAQSDPPICSSAVAMTKKAITSIGGFPPGITAGEDLLTWARLAMRFDIAYCRSPHAIIHSPRPDMADRLPRLPQSPDHVATGLGELMESSPPEQRENLAEYLALWHRMRAVAFIKSSMINETRHEIRRSVAYGGITPRLFMLLLLTCLPGKLPAMLQMATYRRLQRIRSLKEKQRTEGA